MTFLNAVSIISYLVGVVLTATNARNSEHGMSVGTAFLCIIWPVSMVLLWTLTLYLRIRYGYQDDES